MKRGGITSCLVVLLAASPANATPAANARPAADETVVIDPHASTRPFPHTWEKMVGSARAAQTLKGGVGDDFSLLHARMGVKYVRFHGIFHDDNAVYTEDANGKPRYDFAKVDKIYDNVIARGLLPFVELSFMPGALATTNSRHAFLDRAFNSPPKDLKKWGRLVEAFATHLVKRYGLDTVGKMPFEVWNEPNIDFLNVDHLAKGRNKDARTKGKGTKGAQGPAWGAWQQGGAVNASEIKQRVYFDMYREAASAVKRVQRKAVDAEKRRVAAKLKRAKARGVRSEIVKLERRGRALDRLKLRVGGPATAGAAWVPDFIRYCDAHKVPLDFVSTHAYSNEPAKVLLGRKEKVSPDDMLARAIKRVNGDVKASPMPHLPVYWTELGRTYMNKPVLSDSAYSSTFWANTIRKTAGLSNTKVLSPWTGTEAAFDELRDPEDPNQSPQFYGGFGLIARNHVPKASFNGMTLLRKLGHRMVEHPSESVIVTKKGGDYVIAAWNLVSAHRRGKAKVVAFELPGLHGKNVEIEVTRVGPGNGSPLEAWRKMGRPKAPTPAQITKLQGAARMKPAVVSTTRGGSFRLKLDPRELALIRVRPSRDGRRRSER